MTVDELQIELDEARKEIARLQDVACVAQQLFGVKVARVELWPSDAKGRLLIVTCPGGDEQKLANLVGLWLVGRWIEDAISAVSRGKKPPPVPPEAP